LVDVADRDDPAINAQDFSERYFGAEVADYIIDPTMRLTAGSGAREVSMLGVLGALVNWTVPLVNVTGGLDTLPRTLAERVAVTYDAEVSGIAETGSGVTVSYRSARGESQTTEADYCIIAAMYDVARRLWQPLDRYAADFAPKLRNVKLISVSLGYRVLSRSKAYVVEIPTREFPDVLLMFLQQNKAPDRVPPGHSLVTLYTDTLATDRYLALPDREIETWAGGIVESLFPELRQQRDLCEIHRWPKAGYLAEPGFWRRARALLDRLPVDGRVQIAGDLFGAGSMESAVRWGKRAAQRILATASAGTSSDEIEQPQRALVN
jgi:protoporphyrinogen oxidase